MYSGEWFNFEGLRQGDLRLGSLFGDKPTGRMSVTTLLSPDSSLLTLERHCLYVLFAQVPGRPVLRPRVSNGGATTGNPFLKNKEGSVPRGERSKHLKDLVRTPLPLSRSPGRCLSISAHQCSLCPLLPFGMGGGGWRGDQENPTQQGCPLFLSERERLGGDFHQKEVLRICKGAKNIKETVDPSLATNGGWDMEPRHQKVRSKSFKE